MTITLEVDFSEVPSTKPAPKGRYPLRVEEATIYTKEGGEFPTIAWIFHIKDGEHAEKRVRRWDSFNPKALFSMIESFMALGVIETEDDKVSIETDQESGAILEPSLVGRECVGLLDVEDYQGKPQNKLIGLEKPGGKAGASRARKLR